MKRVAGAHESGGGHVAEIALLALLATLWGASYTFIKVGVETISPLTLVAARTAIAAVLLFGALRLRGVAMPTDLATWRRFLAQACLNSVVPFTLIAWAEQTVDASVAAILNAATPVAAFVLALPSARATRATGLRLFGVACGMAGVVLIVGVQALGAAGDRLMAELAIVAATLCYAGAAQFGRAFGRLDPMLPAAGSLACGAVVLAPLSLVVDSPWTLSPSGRSIVALLCLAALSTALALTLYFRLLRTLGAVGATSQAYLRVPVGVAIGVAFLGETLSPTALAGSILIFTGVAAMTLGRRDGHAHSPTPARGRTRLSASCGLATASRPDRDSVGTDRRTGQ